MTVRLGPDDAVRLQACLSGDGVAVIPTDTVYGLACSPDSKRAVDRLYELKGRPANKPAAVMFFALEHALDALPELGPRTRAALSALLPGPVTLLLPNPRARFPLAGDPSAVRAEALRPDAIGSDNSRLDVLGLRVPRFAPALAALCEVTAPALQSSANLSGQADPRRLADIPVTLRDGVDLALDGGPLGGLASTVIDLLGFEREGSWRVLREGPLTSAAIASALDHLLA